MNMDACPICTGTLYNSKELPKENYIIECVNCGKYKINFPAINDAILIQQNMPGKIRQLSYSLRQLTIYNLDTPSINTTWIQNILKNFEHPSPLKQAENLIRWYGTVYARQPQQWVSWDHKGIQSIVGATGPDGIQFILRNLDEKQYLDVEYNVGATTRHIEKFRLNFDGWRYFDTLMKGKSDSKFAFMAMPFRFTRLNNIFEEYLIPTVKATGYSLERADNFPRAGDITNKIREWNNK